MGSEAMAPEVPVLIQLDVHWGAVGEGFGGLVWGSSLRGQAVRQKSVQEQAKDWVPEELDSGPGACGL